MATPRTSFSSQIKLFLCLAVVFSCSPVIRSQQNKHPSADRERGIRLYNQNDNKGAVTALRAAIKLNKEDGESWHYLGLALIRLDDFKAARKAFETAVKLRPVLGPAHTGLAYTLMLTGRNEQAEREASIAIDLNKQDARAHYILGVIHLRMRRNLKARAEAELVIAQRPNLAPAYLLKCQALLALKGDESVRFSKVVRVHSDEPPSEEERAERARHLQKTLDLYAAAADALQTYLELAASDQATAIWKDQLETLRLFAGAGGRSIPSLLMSSWEVTTKVRILSKPEPTYTGAARNSGIVGTVILNAVFSSSGKVEHILVLRSLPLGLTEQSIEAAKRIRFLPATKDGSFVSMIMELQYDFNLY
jgi:tetratricopeptide (TPR) repeat protein